MVLKAFTNKAMTGRQKQLLTSSHFPCNLCTKSGKENPHTNNFRNILDLEIKVPSKMVMAMSPSHNDASRHPLQRNLNLSNSKNVYLAVFQVDLRC